MPRYFFNIFDGTDIFDNEGTVLAGAREMRLHMVSTALALFTEEAGVADGTWQMEALDEHGKIVGTMEFGLEPNDHGRE